MKKIGLRAARVDAGLTQEDVFKTLGVSQHTVMAWEKGEKTPDEETFEKLCKMYGVKRKELRI